MLKSDVKADDVESLKVEGAGSVRAVWSATRVKIRLRVWWSPNACSEHWYVIWP